MQGGSPMPKKYGVKDKDVGRAELMAKIMLTELTRRGVLGDLRSE